MQEDWQNELGIELMNQRLYALAILTCTFKLPSIEVVPIYILVNVWNTGLIWEKKKKTKHFFWSSTARFLVILHCRQIAATSIWVVTTSTSCSVYRDIVGILWASPEVTVLKFLNTSYDSRPLCPHQHDTGEFSLVCYCLSHKLKSESFCSRPMQTEVWVEYK